MVWMCSLCGKRYKREAYLKKHKCSWCEKCSTLYSTFQKFSQHQCLQREFKTSFVCCNCQRKYANQRNLQKHKCSWCPLCRHIYSSIQKLKHHRCPSNSTKGIATCHVISPLKGSQNKSAASDDDRRSEELATGGTCHGKHSQEDYATSCDVIGAQQDYTTSCDVSGSQQDCTSTRAHMESKNESGTTGVGTEADAIRETACDHMELQNAPATTYAVQASQDSAATDDDSGSFIPTSYFKTVNEDLQSVLCRKFATQVQVFSRVSFSWQSSKCELLNLPLVKILSPSNVCKMTPGTPQTIMKIIGDGNCFFRCISFYITGSESFHGEIRALVVSHMNIIKGAIERYCLNRGQSVEEYLNACQMSLTGIWATEVEIFVASHLLNTDIFIYTLSGAKNKWNRHSGRALQKNLNVETNAIYLNHANQNHYEVVLDVAPILNVSSIASTYHDPAVDTNPSNHMLIKEMNRQFMWKKATIDAHGEREAIMKARSNDIIKDFKSDTVKQDHVTVKKSNVSSNNRGPPEKGMAQHFKHMQRQMQYRIHKTPDRKEADLLRHRERKTKSRKSTESYRKVGDLLKDRKRKMKSRQSIKSTRKVADQLKDRKRKTKSRQRTESDKKEADLLKDRERKTQLRQSIQSDRKIADLLKDCKRKMKSRRSTVTERVTQLFKERTQKAETRKTRTKDEKVMQQVKDTTRKAEIRTFRTSDEKVMQQVKDTTRKAETRKSRTSDEKVMQQVNDTTRKAETRKSRTSDEKVMQQVKDTTRKAETQKSRTSDEKFMQQLKDTTRKTETQKSRTSDEKVMQQVKDTTRKAEIRKSKTSDEKVMQQVKDTTRKAETRKSRTRDEKDMQQVKDTTQKAETRKSRTSDEKDMQQVKDTTRKAETRKSRTSDEKVMQQVKEKIRKKETRKCENLDYKELYILKDKKRKRETRQCKSKDEKQELQVKDKKRKLEVRQNNSQENREIEKMTNREGKRKLRLKKNVNDCLREKKKDGLRKQTKQSEKSCEDNFTASKKQFPSYVCTCCQRTWYKTSVSIFHTTSFSNTDASLLTACCSGSTSVDGQKYICDGCKLILKNNKKPPLSVANYFNLDRVPKELKILVELESVLIAQRILFYKLVNLPRGGQKGFRGTLVNVPIDVAKINTSLPRTPDEAGIIPLKLKRKLEYKGHHMHQNIRPEAVFSALHWLRLNNIHYANVALNDKWEQSCYAEDPDLWDEFCEEDRHETMAMSAECKHQEDDVESKAQGIQYDTCLHPSNIMHAGNEKYCIAPGEGRIPQNIFFDPLCEALAFPTLFPLGRGTLYGNDNAKMSNHVDSTSTDKEPRDARQPNVSPKRYFIQRLTNIDGRFATNITYLFYALYMTEKKQVEDAINIAVRKARKKSVTAGELRNPEALRAILVTNQAFQFLRQVRGSPSYWQLAQFELLALVRSKGPFTWFLTLSCADTKWPETVQAIAAQQGKELTDEEVEEMTSQERHNWLRQNPITAARQFDHRLQAFMRDVVLSKDAPIGKVSCFFQRTEFQLRGSPHAHIALWVENAPQLSIASDEQIVTWVDKYITCELPSEEDILFSEVKKQRHSHSVACRKKNMQCRFHYPKPPSEKTILTRSQDDQDRLITDDIKDTLQKVANVLETNPINTMSIEEILKEAEVCKDKYYRCLSWAKSRQIVLKRQPSEININNYNKRLLHLWKANMDLQFVCDPYACIAYSVAYVTKDEKEMSQMLKTAAKEVQNADIRTKLKHIGSAFLSNREVSAQEAAYRVLSIPLKRFNCKLVWIPTDLPEERISILKSHTQINLLEDDDTDVYATSIVDRYAARPKSLIEMCLAQFSSWYQLLKKAAVDLVLDQADPEAEIDSDQDNSDGTPELPIVITLIDGKGVMKKMNKQAIPRYHIFSENKEPEKFYHQQLLLFFPWRNESIDLLGDHQLYEDSYEQVYSIVQSNRSLLEHHSDMVAHALNDYEQFGPPLHAWDMLDTEGQQTRAEDQITADREKIENDTANPTPIERDHIQVAPSQVATSIKPYAMEDNHLKEMIRLLNLKQRQVFQHIVHWCMQVKMGLQPLPFHIFVSGGAGTGKSMLIRAIYHQATRMLLEPGDDPEQPTVLLTAPTGCAAYNIGGATLHGALYLPLGKYYSLRSNPSLFATFQNRMAKLKILVIDEVSMVGRRIFAYIHQRLQEAKGVEDTNVLFGGVSILVVGDMFQLPPVNQYKIFATNPTHDIMETGAILSGLWHDCFKLVELDEIMRQRDDKAFAEMLNRIRIGKNDESDIALLQSRVVAPSNPAYPSDALHIFSRRKAVDDHNAFMLSKANTGEKVVINAITKVPPVVASFDDSAPIGGLVSTLEIIKGARVMLIRNMDVSDGLVNGATGIVLDIIYGVNNTNMPKCVIVQFDDHRVGTLTRQSSSMCLISYDHGTPILPIEVKQNVGRSESSPKLIRIQIPLVLCWATTIHKVQGATLRNVVMSCKYVHTKGMLYVALSRVTSISGLHLLDFKSDSIKTCRTTDQEMKRLQDNPLSILVQPLLSSPDEAIRICWFNVQSAWHGHQKDMKADPFLNSSHLLALSETWQSRQSNSTINLPDFPFGQYCPRLQGERGGVAFLAKSDYPITNIFLPSPPQPGMEAIAVVTRASSTEAPLQLVLIYRTQNVTEARLENWLEDVIHSLDISVPTLFGGDFNVDLISNPDHKLIELFDKYGFSQQVCAPTHNKGALLDHVWINKPVHCKTLIVGSYYSDHCQIYTDIHIDH